MGANLALKYAGEEGDKCIFKSIVSIANPFDITLCSKRLSRMDKLIYDYFMALGYRKNVEKNLDMFKIH
jgi:predicted alpha/beta-fold hydrolase